MDIPTVCRSNPRSSSFALEFLVSPVFLAWFLKKCIMGCLTHSIIKEHFYYRRRIKNISVSMS